MIPQSVLSRMKIIFSHQPFCCDKLLFYEIVGNELLPVDRESGDFRQIYDGSLRHTLDQKAGFWYGNIIGKSAGHQWGGRYYAGCVVNSLLIIVGKIVGTGTSAQDNRPPIDSYFLDAVSNRALQLLRISSEEASGVDLSGITPEGEQVFSELRSLDACEQLWRAQYGAEQWLAVKDGQVVAHDVSRTSVEREVRERNIQPPVLFVPPANEEIKADILSIDRERSSQQ
jgi:hypothetical protein